MPCVLITAATGRSSRCKRLAHSKRATLSLVESTINAPTVSPIITL